MNPSSAYIILAALHCAPSMNEYADESPPGSSQTLRNIKICDPISDQLGYEIDPYNTGSQFGAAQKRCAPCCFDLESPTLFPLSPLSPLVNKWLFPLCAKLCSDPAMQCDVRRYENKSNRTIYPLPLIKTKSTLVVSKSTIVSLQALAFLPELADNSLEVRMNLVLRASYAAGTGSSTSTSTFLLLVPGPVMIF
jgi:hypothetical protein